MCVKQDGVPFINPPVVTPITIYLSIYLSIHLPAMQCNAMQCNAMQCNVMPARPPACLPACGGTPFFLILCECTATGSSISLCKLFANNICVNQDGVPFMNPLVDTPNIWCRKQGIQGFRSSGTVHLMRKWVRSNFISWHTGKRKQFKRKGRDTTGQPERREIESPLRIASTRQSYVTSS